MTIRRADIRKKVLAQYDSIQAERNREGANYTFEQITFFIQEGNRILELLARLPSRKGTSPAPGKKRGGRPKRMHDSEGNPLYNNSPKLAKPEDHTSKKKFLEGITGGTEETESDS